LGRWYYAGNPRAQAIATAARELVEKRDLWLNPPDPIERVLEVVQGFPDRVVPCNAKAAAILKAHTLTNLYNKRGTPEGVWLDNLHRALDEAVAAAYGRPAALSDDAILSRLLELNRARAATRDGASLLSVFHGVASQFECRHRHGGCSTRRNSWRGDQSNKERDGNGQNIRCCK